MKKIDILLKYSLISLLATMLLSSCTHDDMGGATSPVGAEVTFTMTLPVSYDVPTRTVGSPDENRIGNMLILLFDKGNSDQYQSTITIPGDEISVASGAMNNNKCTFKAEIPTGSYRLMFVANVLESDLNGLNGKTFDEAYGILEKACPYTNKGDKWVVDESDNLNNKIVMWGETDFPLNSDNEIKMTRMLAKVTVTSTADKFVLKEVRFCNYNLTGRIAPVSGGGMNIPQNANNQYGHGKALIYEDGEAIYVAEAKTNGEYKESEKDETSWMGNPCVLIKGSYDKNDDSWYRLDFIDNDKKWIGVERNHAYTFTVKSVSGNGYGTDKEAFERAPINLDGKIGWDVQNLGDIYINGEAFFTVSSTLFNYEYDESQKGNNPSINNMTVRYSEKTLEINPKSEIIEITGDVNNKHTDGTGWLAVTVTNKGTSLKGVYDFDIRVSFDENTTGAERTAEFEIKAGENTILVTVNQDYERELEVTTTQDSIHICGEAEIPVTVKNHRTRITLRAVDAENNVLSGPGLGQVHVVVGQRETTMKVAFNGTGIDREVRLQWSYSSGELATWTNFSVLTQRGNVHLLTSGMYVAKVDLPNQLNWAQALGIDVEWNSKYFGAGWADPCDYNRTQFTGCFTYTQNNVAGGANTWWAPQVSDMTEIIKREPPGMTLGTKAMSYWVDREDYKSGGQYANYIYCLRDSDGMCRAIVGTEGQGTTYLKTQKKRVRCVSKQNEWNRPLVRRR